MKPAAAARQARASGGASPVRRISQTAGRAPRNGVDFGPVASVKAKCPSCPAIGPAPAAPSSEKATRMPSLSIDGDSAAPALDRASARRPSPRADLI